MDVMKNTGATLDFAAMMAQAARVYKPFDPEFSAQALSAAKKAWKWAEAHPEVMYRQNQMNEQFDPDVLTGAYGTWNISGDKFWAGVELFITTGDLSYYDEAGWKEEKIGVPSWGNVRALGLYSLVFHSPMLSQIDSADKELMKQTLIDITQQLVEEAVDAPYRSPFGLYVNHFFWGSNGEAGNIGMAALQAYRLTGDETYYNAAVQVANYLLGMNATGYSFITGFGDKQLYHLHHRPSEADGIKDPVPGLVSGGPNPGNMSQDCGEDAYPFKEPALAFIDELCSYSTNEITINWNAPVVYLLSGIEALKPSH
ncbi:MAG TPA: hypothetical protein DEQ34_11115 [Balneolaceae bacterium]|nr:hypothetical protein [Balneolaceae bacterium]